MLVLTRKFGEEVVVLVDGQVIGTVTICSIIGGKTRVGFSFNKDVKVLRKEIYENEQKEKLQGGETNV